MAGRRICTGYYRRYDGKAIYVVSTAMDDDTGEETVIWTPLPFSDPPRTQRVLLRLCGRERSAESQVRPINMKLRRLLNGWRRAGSAGRCAKHASLRWMNTTAVATGTPSPITDRQKISVRTTSSAETSIVSV